MASLSLPFSFPLWLSFISNDFDNPAFFHCHGLFPRSESWAPVPISMLVLSLSSSLSLVSPALTSYLGSLVLVSSEIPSLMNCVLDAMHFGLGVRSAEIKSTSSLSLSLSLLCSSSLEGEMPHDTPLWCLKSIKETLAWYNISDNYLANSTPNGLASLSSLLLVLESSLVSFFFSTGCGFGFETTWDRPVPPTICLCHRLSGILTRLKTY